MTSPISIVHNFLTLSINANSTSSIGHSSLGQSMILTGLKIIHWGWWLSIKKETYSKERNFVYLLGGSFLDRFIGDRGPLRLAVQVYILALRTHRILEELTLFNHEFSQLIDAIKGNYVPRPSQKWSIEYSEHLLAEHLKKQKALLFNARIQRIKTCAKQVFHRLFSISNRCFHAYEGFYASTHPEILVETIEGIENLIENKEEILNQLQMQREIIDYFIQAMHLPISFEEVVSGLEKGLKGAEIVYHVMNKLCKYVENYLFTMIKASITAVAIFFNFERKLPAQLHSNPERQAYLKLQ